MYSRISDSLSAKITNLNFFCALLVVLIHVKWMHSGAGACWFVDSFLAKGFALIAVPCFFFCSGYFLAGHVQEGKWWRSELLKRVKSLLIPFLLWNFIAFALTSAPLGLVSDYLAHRDFGTSVALSDNRWIATWGFDFSDVPCLGPLWYVRALLVFVCLSPLLKFVLDYLHWLGLFIIVGSCAVCYSLGVTHGPLGGFFHYGFSLLGMIFFATGFYVRTRSIAFHSRTVAVACWVIGTVALLVKVYFHQYADVADIVFIPSFMYGVWYFMPSSRAPYQFVAWSFPLYLIHRLILPYFATVLKNVGWGSCFLALVSEYVISVILSLGVAFVLKVKFPKVSTILFGGR